MQKIDNRIAARINLVKLPANTIYEFELDQNTDWVKDILVEMNENAKEKSPEEYLKESSLAIKGEIQKKNKADWGEYLTVAGTIEAKYATECVRTLRPMTVEMNLPFKICFVDESLSTTEMFAETDETWVDNEVYELYFYSKRTVDFQEMIHEQIFLNYDQYPVLDAECKLDGISTLE